MHEKRVARAYRFELWTAIAAYVVLLVASIRYGRPLPDGLPRTVVLLSPMIGFGLMIRAGARHIARIDEYQRLRLLESLALAFAITAAVTFSYGFLETAGFARLSMFSVWMVMCASWGIANVVLALRARRAAGS
ncbi:hypothetical protein [Massilia rhizosphaerae]|uniref:hypothetical protein n=1 Tax=Massilia rhizosphaerae TaxID=2784389 RepID=UPI0018DE4536|nr:hypothetical protein [Massilia rhizosphaerae]